MHNRHKTLALAVSSAFALSIAATPISAAENPFALTTLSSGYQVADHHEKDAEGKCGAGKCGASMKETTEGKCSAEKAHEGKCGGNKDTEGSCGADKAHEGACGSEKK